MQGKKGVTIGIYQFFSLKFGDLILDRFGWHYKNFQHYCILRSYALTCSSPKNLQFVDPWAIKNYFHAYCQSLVKL